MVTEKMIEAFAKASSVASGDTMDCVRAGLEAALSTDAEPDGWISEDEFTLEKEHADEWKADGLEPKPFYFAPPAPSVAVKADLPERFEEWWSGRDSKGEKTLDYNQRKQLAWDAFYAALLSAHVQDVATTDDELFWRLRIAYLRGAEWRHQTGSMELSDKASYDYADKITSPIPAAPAAKLEER